MTARERSAGRTLVWAIGLTVVGLAGASAFGAARVFMALPGDQAVVAPGIPYTVFMDPGTSVTLEVWIEDTTPQLLGGYQVAAPGVVPLAAGTGTVTYIDRPTAPPPATQGDSVAVNTSRPEWVFNGLPGGIVFFSETGLPAGFAFIGIVPLGVGALIPGLGYMGEFELEASADASGTFVLDFLPDGAPPNGGTALNDETGVGPVAFSPQRTVIKVGPQPANDECAGAVAMFAGDLPFDTTKSTTSDPNTDFGGPGNAVCDDNGNDTIQNDIWFTYTAQCEGVTTVSTCDQATFDSRIEVYQGCGVCPPSPLIACNDDGLSCGGGTSATTFFATQGTCYTIRLGGSDIIESGFGTLTINSGSCFINNTCRAAGELNPLNECESCIPQLTQNNWSARAAGATCTDDAEVCTIDQCDGAGVCAHPPANVGTACPDDGQDCTLDACDGAGACAHPPAMAGTTCPDDGAECTLDQCDGAGVCGHPPAGAGLPCIDDGDVCTLDQCDGAGVCGHPAGPAGVPCDDGLACTGTGEPGVGIDECDAAGNCVGQLDPNCSDNCIDAAVAFEGQNLGNNTGFGTEIIASCALSAHDAWFVHQAFCDGDIRFNTVGSSIDTVLTVYDACGGPELACDDDGAPGADATITIPVTAGQDYFVRVAGFNGAQGAIVLNITRLDACLIDSVCRAPGEVNPANACEVCLPVFETEGWWPRSKGTACGNGTPTNPECDAADACDGAGVCEANHKPLGLFCGDPTNTECDNPDICDGGGSCVDNFETAGASCGDGNDDDCDNPDTCSGLGSCLDNFEVTGFACGDPTNTACDNPDTCDGSGGCLINLEPDGTPCPNVQFCDGVETCLTGACVDNADPCIDDPHCDDVADVCLDCLLVNECADADANGIIDDACIWYDCVTNACIEVPRVFADAGGPFGDCPVDGFANVHDRNHVLSCFSSTNPCESINIDVGGPFGDCAPDGFCNVHDANHVLAAFAGNSACACPLDGGGPAPQHVSAVVGAARLDVVPDVRAAHPGDEVVARVFVAGALEDLRSYQLDVDVSGGRRGMLELVDITLEQRADYVFDGVSAGFSAINLLNGQMLNGLEAGGVETPQSGYLATYRYRVSDDAIGTFVIDVPVSGETYLIASRDGRIDVTSTIPGVVVVTSGPARGIR